mmetsp:Transcript_4707/g.6185  ORF Transcript_4707/g.6185 Transcript_4707/m.6185 type:complete len:374 (+) Transcript_4707:131-1252(+)
MSVKSIIRYTLFSLVGGAIGVGLYYRPIPEVKAGDDDEDKYSLTPVKGEVKPLFTTPVQLAEHAAKKEGFLLQSCRALTIGSVAAFSTFYLNFLNRVYIKNDDKYQLLLRNILSRPDYQPLLTVSNHASTVDDPSLFISIVPWWVNLTPKLMRWSLCTQDICFKNPMFAAFFGLGKVMPIKRGGGIDQKLLLDFGRRLAAGDWCHTFPEGGTCQTGNLHKTRRPTGVGNLKWGTGKLIAHSPTLPIVIPFWHTGMQEILPEHPVDKRLLKIIPSVDRSITLRVGEPINFDDLLEDYEKKHGALKKFSASAEMDPDSWEDYWPSTPEEKELYSAICRRIEDEMAKLEKSAKIELGDSYPYRPEMVRKGLYSKQV